MIKIDKECDNCCNNNLCKYKEEYIELKKETQSCIDTDKTKPYRVTFECDFFKSNNFVRDNPPIGGTSARG